MRNKRIHFTSDTHFGHANIIRYCDRPFRDADTMDQELIARWNEVVAHDDLVYHLGDFTLRGEHFAARILSRLNGHLHVLGYPWHHDKRWVPREPGPTKVRSASGHRVHILPPMVVLAARDLGTSDSIVLCHFPIAQWDRMRHGAWHLHGHTHGRYDGDGACLDVGVDSHDYAPVSLGSLGRVFASSEPQAARAAGGLS